MNRRLLDPDDFMRAFEGRHPGFSAGASLQEIYLRKNDWPILVVVASCLGELHAVAKHKMLNQPSSKLKEMEKVLAYVGRDKIRNRLRRWGLDIPGENELLDRLEVHATYDEYGMTAKMNVTLPWEIKSIFERYRTLGHAMVKDHMNSHMKLLEEEEKKKVVSVSVPTLPTGTVTTVTGKYPK